MGGLGTRIAIGVTSAAAAAGVITSVQPPTSSTPEERRQHQLQQQVENLADAQELDNERIRQEGRQLLDTDMSGKAIPGEYRPPEPPVLRVRRLP